MNNFVKLLGIIDIIALLSFNHIITYISLLMSLNVPNSTMISIRNIFILSWYHCLLIGIML